MTVTNSMHNVILCKVCVDHRLYSVDCGFSLAPSMSGKTSSNLSPFS